MRIVLGHLLDLFLPPSCGACGLPGEPLCFECRSALVVFPPPWCGGCGHPVPVAVDHCPACVGPLVGARAAFAYEGPAPPLLVALKDRRRRGLATVLASRMAQVLPPPPDGAGLVPVPLGPRRIAERGFNQSLVLARQLGRRWRAPVVEALVRSGEEAAQRGASRTERALQVRRAFAAAPGVAVPREAVLVDDVHTTGATLAACARALRRAGAERVGAACFARALDPRLPEPVSALATARDRIRGPT